MTQRCMPGVISRRAAIEGSYPDAKDAAEGDTVAYCGRVPVKLVGSARAGDIVVPSGRGDGTGVAVGKCRAFFTTARVGTAELDLHESDSTQPEGGSPQEIELLSLGKISRGLKWQYIDCSIISPSLSHGRYFSFRAACWIVLLGLLLIGGSWFFAATTTDHGHTPVTCKRIVLAHGNVSGSCDGHAGGTCEYTACDFGYSLAPTSQVSAETELSAEAASPLGGCLNYDALHPFPPCTSCFGDGLMCELRNRTYPLPSPPPPPQVNGLFSDQTVWPEYPYACPSSTQELQSCEPQGRLCFGPYNGFPPCEYCNARDGTGLACEASSRYVRWGLR